MEKAIIIGILGSDASDAIAYALAHRNQENMKDAVVCVIDNNEKNVINEQFEPEPIVLHNYHKEHFVPKIKDFPRNKFIYKPRFNHRKR